MDASLIPSLTPLFADDALLVFDKPAGLLSVPGRGPEHQDCLARRAQAIYPEARTVHRLDMATSGLILMARGPAMERALSRLFAERQVEKTYIACVAGQLQSIAGEIDLPLICDWPNRPRQKVDFEIGKPSLTHYRCLAYSPETNTSRLELTPYTGRSHQLRVHLSAIGHPILGDTLYAPPEVQAQAPRLLLHASRLAFTHPVTQETLQFESPAGF